MTLFRRAFIPLLFILVIWHGLAILVMWFRDVAFPTPWATFERLVDLLLGANLAEHSAYAHIAASLRRWALGFGLSAVLGVGYGLAAGRMRILAHVTAGIPRLLLLVPGLAWIPAAILLFGIGETATVFMIFLSAFAPIAVNVLSGIKRVDIHLIRAARMLGARRATLFLQVLVPAALPAILCGLRIGLGTSWRVLVAAEMVVGTGTGLGYSIIQARWNLDYTSSFACIAIICALGALLEHVLLARLERKTLERWMPREARP